MAKRCQLVTDGVSVVCPHCGECQPSPDDGSHIWTAEDFPNNKLTRCVGCEEPITILPAMKAQFDCRVIGTVP